MKNHILLGLFITIYSTMNAQVLEQKETISLEPQQSKSDSYEIKTLFGNNGISNGAYFGVTVAYTELNNEEALLVGGRGAWIINHWLGLGIGGYGLTNPVYTNNLAGDKQQVELGYGGFLVEPIIGSRFPVHISFPTIIGAGGLAMTDRVPPFSYPEPTDYEQHITDADAFFVFEPGIDLEFNLLKHMRLGIGANYRYIKGLEIENIKSRDISGPSINMSLKVGSF